MTFKTFARGRRSSSWPPEVSRTGNNLRDSGKDLALSCRTLRHGRNAWHSHRKIPKNEGPTLHPCAPYDGSVELRTPGIYAIRLSHTNTELTHAVYAIVRG